MYNGSINRRPALIARPHGVAGTSLVEGGVVVDLGSMKGVHVEVEHGTAVAQGGALWGEHDRETELFGVATPGGRVTTTGVGGILLGGGYGWLSPVHGLTCDNLVSADVVRGYREYVERAPEQLVTALATVLAPPELGR